MLATCYAAFFGGLLVLGARLGDRYGPRRILVIGVVAFVLTSVVGATASEIGQLLIATALRGAAAAISVPCALRLLLHVADSSGGRRSAVAAWSACGALAGVLGYVVGGVLTQTMGWRAIYWINVPVGLVLLAGVLVAVPALASQPEQRLDIPGAALLVGAVMSLIVGAALLEREELRLAGVLDDRQLDSFWRASSATSSAERPCRWCHPVLLPRRPCAPGRRSPSSSPPRRARPGCWPHCCSSNSAASPRFRRHWF